MAVSSHHPVPPSDPGYFRAARRQPSPVNSLCSRPRAPCARAGPVRKAGEGLSALTNGVCEAARRSAFWERTNDRFQWASAAAEAPDSKNLYVEAGAMLLFCPSCGNGLIVEEGQRCHRFACNTCPYVHNITRKVSTRGERLLGCLRSDLPAGGRFFVSRSGGSPSPAVANPVASLRPNRSRSSGYYRDFCLRLCAARFVTLKKVARISVHTSRLNHAFKTFSPHVLFRRARLQSAYHLSSQIFMFFL